MSYRVLCPSMRRAKLATSHQHFKPENFWYVVNANEVDDYLAMWPNVVSVPMGATKNIVTTRNWILDNAEHSSIIMVDDDITKFFWTLKAKRHQLGVEDLHRLIVNGFEMARDAGAPLWGMNLTHDTIMYRPCRPFSLNKPVLGPFSALCLESLQCAGIRYDETLTLKEDYDLFLQIAHARLPVLRFNYLSYLCDHQKMEGGCQIYRTDDKERQQAEQFTRKWGSTIVCPSQNDSINLRIRVPEL